MKKVYSVQDAMNWFLSHSSGSVVCVKADGAEKEVDNYPDAKEFFEQGK